jgi:hypothetical protein
MRPSALKQAIANAFRVNRPMMIHGSPGIGKSDIVDQTRIAEGYEHMQDLRLSQLDQVDLRGVPSVVKGTTTWNPPDFLPRLPKTVLFLDEINSASPGVMAAAYELILNRRCGDYKLPDDCRMICAGNLSTDFAFVNQMPSALKNRMTHVTLEVNNEDWYEWAIQKGIHLSIIAFLRFRPTLLNEFDQANKTVEAKNKGRNMREATAFATPRTWEIMSDYLHLGLTDNIRYDTYQGIVGDGVAAEFSGFERYYMDLPDLQELLKNPKKARVPDEPATLYALSTGLAALLTPETFAPAVEYTNQLPKEFQVLMVRDGILRNRNLVEDKGFTRWALDNQSYLQ